MALGLLLSSFARTEFQAVQFMPAFIFPQLLLAGLFVARDEMPVALQRLSDAMPFHVRLGLVPRYGRRGARRHLSIRRILD